MGPGQRRDPQGPGVGEGHDATPAPRTGRRPRSPAGRLAPGDQQLEVGLGLQAGQRGVEEVEVGEAALVAGPGQAAGDVVRRAGTGGQHVAAEPSRASWWASSSSTRAWEDGASGPCAGSSARSGSPRTLVSEAMKSRSGWRTGTASKPMDGVIVGSTWSPAKQQAGGAVGEDVVALRVAGGVHGVEGAGPDLDRVVALEPGVRVAPSASGRAGARRPSRPTARRREGPRGAQHVQRRVRVARPGAVQLVERGPLPAAEADVGAELAARSPRPACSGRGARG